MATARWRHTGAHQRDRVDWHRKGAVAAASDRCTGNGGHQYDGGGGRIYVHIKEDESTGTGSGGDVRAAAAAAAASDRCTGIGGRPGVGGGGGARSKTND